MIRRPPRSTQSRSSAASDVYKRQVIESAPPHESKGSHFNGPFGHVLRQLIGVDHVIKGVQERAEIGVHLLHERADSLYFLSTALEGELVAAQGNINVQKLLEHTEVRIMLSHEHLSYVVIQRQYLLRHAGLPTFPATQ